MRVHVLSNHNTGLGFAIRFKQVGHDTRLIGPVEENGMVPIGPDGHAPDLVINLAAKRNQVAGAKYLGPTIWSEALEGDAEYASKIIGLIGWPQQPIHQGTNLYITAWFNGDTTLMSYATILYRRLMAGGCGPDIGRSGSVSLFESLTDKAHETFIKPLEKVLKRVSHQGVFHIHVVTNANSFYVRGVSTQLYSPLTLAALENTNLAVANVFLKTLDVTSRVLRPLDPVASSLLVTVPPYPYYIGEISEERSVVGGINPGSLKHLWLEDISCDKNYTVGWSGCIGHVTARGASPQEACRRMYKTVSNMNAEDIQYRNDVGRNINTLLEALRSSGWIY